MTAKIIYILALFMSYDVPPQYAGFLFDESLRQNVSPFETGAILMAENRSMRFDPATVGKHNGGGELGLFQLQPSPWARFCGLKKIDLIDPAHNIQCAVTVIAHMQDKAGIDRSHTFWIEAIEHHDYDKAFKGMRRKTRTGLDWQTAYRCAPAARTSENCKLSVNRVLRMHQMLLKAHYAEHDVWWYFRVTVRLPSIALRYVERPIDITAVEQEASQ